MTNSIMKNSKNQLLLLYLSLILVSCSSHRIPSTPTPVSIDSEIKQLLQDNNCKPPCFLGIIPEQTTVEELETIFTRYGTPLQKSSFGYSTPRDEQLIPYTTFSIRDNKVHSISISVATTNEFAWFLYSPKNVMERFGTPSKVEFGMTSVNGSLMQGWYTMKYYYDDLDFVIQYLGLEVRLAELITVCPNTDKFNNASLSLGKDPVLRLLDTFNFPLEEVTSFTLESFREYMLGTAACFDLKGKAWQDI